MEGTMGTVLWQKRRLLQSSSELLVAILFGTLLSFLAVPSNAAEQKIAETSKAPTSATLVPSPPSGIPVEEIAMQATQVGDLLRGFTRNLAARNEIEAIQKFLPPVSVDISLELKSTANILKEQPSLEMLQAQEQIWQQRQSQLTIW